MSRGHDRERLTCDLLEVGLSPHGVGDPWWVMRSAGSLGDVDVVAAQVQNDDEWAAEVGALEFLQTELLVIEVKSDALKHGPFNNFGPRRRAELIAAAELAGGEPWLVWIPPSPPGIRGIWGCWLPPKTWPAHDYEQLIKEANIE